jgi:hypothetical protein
LSARGKIIEFQEKLKENKKEAMEDLYKVLEKEKANRSIYEVYQAIDQQN